MKLLTLTFTAALLTGCSQAPSNAVDAQADAHMPAHETTAMPAAAATTASASGTVESVDASAGKITISHGPVAALKWPAMTMGFKAAPELLASVQPGQKIQFEFESQGMDSTITQITPQE